MTPRASAPLVLCLLLLACGSAPRQPDAVVFELGRPVVAGEIDMGGDPPGTPAGGLLPGQWHDWARTAWPAACRALKVREIIGRIPRTGRSCAVTHVAGIVPTATVTAGGTLESGDERLPVGWSWTTTPGTGACATDPLDDRPRRYRLVRSRDRQYWRATPVPDRDIVADDPVRATCADLDRFLARGG